ncbi:MAG: hypothetical protein JW790_02640 [Dehalococcoidales bacterium]|nr:hypothetical protein [Dehalococcoidales bacterium]
MVKPKRISFTEALEKVLINIWGGTKDHLEDSLVRKTRKALVEIKGAYRFRGEFPKKYPSTIQYRLSKNRAGYLAAFGQRHAYLTYSHLKRVEAINSAVIPKPEENGGELVITILGAGTAIETYGICFFYNEESQRLRKLRLNLIEKIDAWIPNRHTVFDKLLKGTFPKLDIIPVDIAADLTKDCIPKFANYYDAIAKSNILLIYNVMNEITAIHSDLVWRNISFILNNCEQPLLILLAEPSSLKASPRVNWLKTQLAQASELILIRDEEEFFFNSDPLRINFENTGVGLNDRLFGQTMDGSKPQLQTSIKRTLMTCRIEPRSPISMEQVLRQLAMLKLKRGAKGRFIRRPSPQATFWDEHPDWYS